MSSPASKTTGTKTKTASMDSTCTTFSDIIRALDEAHDRIASMGVDDMKAERVDSIQSMLEESKAKFITPRKAFDVKKYMADLKNGDITLRQIQVAANAIKLPEEHLADHIRVNGKLPQPKPGPGKCTYDPYPLPPKRKRDALSDNVEDAIKKVKNIFK
ncbi:hypothetical protein E4T48_05355 [Aureobasidium sp. EXF-10727]|nr:hypothetical protein E4T48_05355 [Aureobasidium sp. EXF-10727]KAI4725612.1 hypothetical protein E4T49_06624 [Aureobasidium sp. EXF-10728]